MTIVADEWLGERLGVPAYTVDAADAAELSERAATGEAGFYQARVDCRQTADVRTLSAAGMRVVDVNLTLQRRPGPEDAAASWTIAEAGDDDWDALLDIAGSAFRCSRFHLDPDIDDDTADAIKRSWMESYRDRKRGDHVLVARQGGGPPAGFLAVIVEPATHVIDLVAVSADARGRGAGRALTYAFVDRANALEVTTVRVGTQAANVPATSLYERLRFTLSESAYNLHLLVS